MIADWRKTLLYGLQKIQNRTKQLFVPSLVFTAFFGSFKCFKSNAEFQYSL
jgi:hypothetical protein